MPVTHDSNVTISVILNPPAPTEVTFDAILFLTNGIGAGFTERVRTYTSADQTAISTDLAAGDITAATAKALTTGFSQDVTISTIKVGAVQGVETYAAAYALVVAADDDWYGLATNTRDGANLEALSALINAEKKVFGLQSSDAGWLTTGYPAAFADLEGAERTIGIYHDTDTEFADVAWLANRLAADPDTVSAAWDCALNGVAAYAVRPTASQKGFAEGNNINLMLPYGDEPYWVDPGRSFANRPFYELITADWFEARLNNKVIAEKQKYAVRFAKIPLGDEGVAILEPLVRSQFEEGVAAGHFVAKQYTVTFLPVTAADISAERIRATGSAQLVVSGRVFSFTFNFTREAVV